MSRFHLMRGLKTATIAVVVSAIAIALFGKGETAMVAHDSRFWTVLGAVAVGAFMGSMLFGKPKENSE